MCMQIIQQDIVIDIVPSDCVNGCLAKIYSSEIRRNLDVEHAWHIFMTEKIYYVHRRQQIKTVKISEPIFFLLCNNEKEKWKKLKS